jgi:hypothetical protein
LLQQESIRNLYQRRLNEYVCQTAVGLNTEEEWEDFQDLIFRVAKEVVGTRKKRKHTKRLKIWNDELDIANKEKKRSNTSNTYKTKIKGQITIRHVQ